MSEAITGVWRWPNDKERSREMATGAALSLLDQMTKHVRVLGLRCSGSMLGLLGTVLGMIAAFNEMSLSGGAVDPTELAGGIWIALSTTALGLIIAIPVLLLHQLDRGRIDCGERAAMDTTLILAIVYGPGVDSATQVRTETVALGPSADPYRRGGALTHDAR